MPTIGDLARITLCGELFDQTACNVFYYVVAGWTGNLSIEDVTTELVDALVADLLPVQGDDLVYNLVKFDNLTNPSENTQVGLSIPGEDTTNGTTMSPFAAYSIRLFGTSAATRSGYKRIAGIPEGRIDAGGALTTFAAQSLQDAGDTFASSFIATNTDATLNPVIAGRDATGAVDFARLNPISSATVANFMTTQNTRKRGRGV